MKLTLPMNVTDKSDETDRRGVTDDIDLSDETRETGVTDIIADETNVTDTIADVVPNVADIVTEFVPNETGVSDNTDRCIR